MLWWLALAFAVVAVAFMAGTLVAQREASTIEDDALSLHANALPSVERLVAALTAIRHLDASTALLAAEPPGAVPDDVNRARSDLETELKGYLALPSDPGERKLFATSVQPGLKELDAAVGHLAIVVRTHGGGDQRTSALMDVKRALESVDEGLRLVIELNASEATASAEHIISTRQTSVRLATALDALAAIVAVVAAALAIGAAQRYAGKQEREARQLRASVDELNTFALRLAHDVLSPLSAVGLSLAALGRHHGDEPTQRVLERAQRSLVRSRDIASSIYEFARSGAVPTPGQRAPLRATIDAAVEDLLEAEARRPPHVIVESLEDCDVSCETGVLLSMLSNVLSNAAKFSSESPERRIIIRERTAGDRARVEIEDAGPGIPPGLESAIFDPYVRAPGVAQPGLGLGLATVKRYATAHGGAVGARCIGRGLVVWFELPRAPGPPSTGPEPARTPPTRQPLSVH
jgi:signal transduction histidine kinase